MSTLHNAGIKQDIFEKDYRYVPGMYKNQGENEEPVYDKADASTMSKADLDFFKNLPALSKKQAKAAARGIKRPKA